MYTQRESKIVEAQIEEHMKIIKECVLSKLKVKSIILIGTFSRGEGAVFISRNAVIPANDYDLYLIVDRQPSEEIIFSLQNECVRKIREFILRRTDKKELVREFNVDFKCLTVKQLKNLPPILRFYDMKDSLTIYGENHIKDIPLYSSIPLSEGLRLLFNEISHIMEYVSHERFDPKVNYFLSKSYLSIVTSFLMYKNDLATSILKKNKKISKYQVPIKNFKKKLKKYTSYRLEPVESGSFKENFFEVQEDLDSYLRFYLSNFFAVDEKESWISISEKIKKGLYKEYYSPYFKYYGKSYFRINIPKPVLVFLSYLAQYYFSYKFAVHLKNLNKPYFRTFFKKDPGLAIMASLPLVFFSINKNGFDREMIKKANKNLNTMINSGIDSWDELRKKYTEIYKLYFWQKFI